MCTCPPEHTVDDLIPRPRPDRAIILINLVALASVHGPCARLRVCSSLKATAHVGNMAKRTRVSE